VSIVTILADELTRLRREKHRAKVGKARVKVDRDLWRKRALRSYAELRNVEAERDWLQLQLRKFEREAR